MEFKLEYPIKPTIVTQPFGCTDFLQWYKDHGIVFAGHNGIDFHAYHGQPVYASHDGKAFFQTDTSFGHGVVIVTPIPMDYRNTQAYFKTIYWHFCDSTKDPQFKSPIEDFVGGKDVKTGGLIGYADTTGLSTGDHLHFGLKPMYLKYPNDYTNIEQNNGYMGAIDPAPYFNRHTFNIDMNYGDNNAEVRAMQEYFIKNGFMTPIASAEYGQYGPKTRDAVSKFQYKYQVSSNWILFWNGGRYVGPATRRALNNLN